MKVAGSQLLRNRRNNCCPPRKNHSMARAVLWFTRAAVTVNFPGGPRTITQECVCRARAGKHNSPTDNAMFTFFGVALIGARM